MNHFNTIPNNIIFLDVQEKFNQVKNEIIENQRDMFNLYNYYTTKFKGNRLNDVNVGLFLDEEQRPVVQIFIRNITGYIRERLVFNNEGTKIIDILTLNNNINA